MVKLKTGGKKKAKSLVKQKMHGAVRKLKNLRRARR